MTKHTIDVSFDENDLWTSVIVMKMLQETVRALPSATNVTLTVYDSDVSKLEQFWSTLRHLFRIVFGR